MNDINIELDRDEEAVLSYEVSDAALEAAAGVMKDKAGNLGWFLQLDTGVYGLNKIPNRRGRRRVAPHPHCLA